MGYKNITACDTVFFVLRTGKFRFLILSVFVFTVFFMLSSLTYEAPSFTTISSAANYLSQFSSRNEAGVFEDEGSEFNAGSCDIFDGEWVLDDAEPMYKPGTCPFIGDSFNCFKNGRPDVGYFNYKWKPHGCEIPRFNGTRMLEILRGKRLVFVGDSLNRNMWESLVCGLRASLNDKSNVYEVSGRKEFKREGFYSFKFVEYGCSVDFVRSPFLVYDDVKWENGKAQIETVKLDIIHGSSAKYNDADIIIFNTGHWWTHRKSCKRRSCFQEGGNRLEMIEIGEAYRKALKTWSRWVDSNVNGSRTRVFFRGYSPSHFRKGQWNSGGRCRGETEPTFNQTKLAPYPLMMSILESVISEMKTPVFYLNVTKMTDYRKDGHPSIYRPQHRFSKGIEDCSHWCLPGVPDAWNNLLYAVLSASSNVPRN